MLKNYIKIAFRNLWRNKAFSTINISGLAIGIAACLIILLFVQNELSYDRYNEKADRVVRVGFRGAVQGEQMREANVMPPTAQTLRSLFPEVLDATRLHDYGSPRIIIGDKFFNDTRFAFADSNFFQVFTLPFLQGDARTALAQPNSIVVSETAAHTYFGDASPIGKMMHFKGWDDVYKVTGVIKDVPVNSHFHFDLFASMANLPDSRTSSWMTSGYNTYLVLPAGYDYKRLEAKLPQVVEKYMGPQLQVSMGITMTEFRKKGNELGLFLQPLTDIHLRSDYTNELSPGGDIRYVYMFEAIAAFMLLIACINFMNLSTAGAAKRAREVGIRKVLGSVRRELIGQFLLESVLLTAVAMILAIGLVMTVLPFFNMLVGKELHLDRITRTWLLVCLILFGLLVGVLAGSYPAFFLSSFKPVAVLKGKFSSSAKSSGLRSGLVVFQFFISVTLMVSMIVVYKQLNYIRHKELGYNKDQVMVLPGSWALGNNSEAFRQRLLQDPGVTNVSLSGYLPAGPTYNNNFFVYPDNKTVQLVKALRYDVDYQYIPTLGMQMAAGRNFSREFGADSTGVIVNETAAAQLGWGKEALGHRITRFENDGHTFSFHVIGVVKDFHFKSLHERISPLVMVLGDNSGAIIVKTGKKDMPGLLGSIKKQWAELAPQEPFSYSFLDERFNDTYQAEQKTGMILALFAGLTIFVACLGLFGLAMFTAEQRTREIGIRKVLGATVTGIVGLLSKDFLKLVFLANLVAWPLAWWAMNKWLQGFAYRITINWWVFAAAGAGTVLIALLTVGFQAVKAAIANPVESLRAE